MLMIADLLSSFFLGLLTPLTAVCVLPLYPGYIAFIARQIGGDDWKRSLKIGLLVNAGVIAFMALLGIIFTSVLKVSLTSVISIISPIAFSILSLISLLLIFNVDISAYLPKMDTPKTKDPYLRSFFFGFFFGPIIIPCNPGFIAAFFVKSLSAAGVMNMLNFLLFGLGIGFPLLVISLLSARAGIRVARFFAKNARWINLFAGIIMLGISLYYLFFVFQVFG